MKSNYVLISNGTPIANATMTQEKADALNLEYSKSEDYRYWSWSKIN